MATSVLEASLPSEGGHWYDPVTGEPRYRIVGANGVERDTTLRDARKHGWVPSVTTIMACAHKYQLEVWKQEQAALAALTTTRQEGESDADLVKRVLTDAKEQARKAAERGTEIHAAVEAYYSGRLDDSSIEPNWPWVASIRNLITQQFGAQTWRPEKSFAHPLGYGGKVDLHSDAVLLDFKGREKPYSKWRTWDEHSMQLAAYANGLRLNKHEAFFGPTKWPTAGIIFFDRAEPYCEYHEIKPAALEKGWRMFEALLQFWKAANL